jgi:hypothetical protein
MLVNLGLLCCAVLCCAGQAIRLDQKAPLPHLGTAQVYLATGGSLVTGKNMPTYLHSAQAQASATSAAC